MRSMLADIHCSLYSSSFSRRGKRDTNDNIKLGVKNQLSAVSLVFPILPAAFQFLLQAVIFCTQVLQQGDHAVQKM